MVKYFCDACGEQIIETNEAKWSGPNTNSSFAYEGIRLGTKVKGLSVSVTTAKDNVANDGVYCKYCIIDAINTLDDRPRESQPR